VAPNLPVYLVHVSGHLAVANRAALKAAGIDRSTPTPAGGVIERDASGANVFALDLTPRLPGLQSYKIRMYPFHPTLAHRLEAGYMLWL